MNDVLFIEEKAKLWLIDQVKHSFSWENFQVLSSMNYEESNILNFAFDCSYQWQVEGKIKTIRRTVFVIYKPESGKFISVF
jgi:hypothetical protein